MITNSYNYLNAQSNWIIDNGGLFITNDFLKNEPFSPTAYTNASTLKIGFGYSFMKNRTEIYGGNLGVSQAINNYGDSMGKWSFKGAWTLPKNPLPIYSGLLYPGLNYLIDYHRWGDYSAFFGLRERATEINKLWPPEGMPSYSPDELLKDAVISFNYEHTAIPNKLIFQSVIGVNDKPIGSSMMNNHTENELMTLLYDGKLGLGISIPTSQIDIKPKLNTSYSYALNIRNINGINKTSFSHDGEVTLIGTLNKEILNLKRANNQEILKIQEDGEMFYPLLANGNLQQLYIDGIGKIQAGNNNLTQWDIGGNSFPAVGPIAFSIGTITPHNFVIKAGGTDVATIFGDYNGRQGWMEFEGHIGMGGHHINTIGGYQSLDYDYTLAVKSSDNVLASGPFRAINSDNISMFQVGNSVVSILPNSNEGWEFVDAIGAITSNLVPKDPVNNYIGTITTPYFEIHAQSTYVTNYQTPSDRRLKSNIKPFENSLEQVLKLEPVSYNYNKTPNELALGFIAQDVNKIFPEIAKNNGAFGDTFTISMLYFIPVLTKAIQEQQSIIDSLKSKINTIFSSNNQNQNNEPNEIKVKLNSLPILFQNNPNPFKGITYIDFYIPKESNNAFIKIIDNAGKLIKVFNIDKFGFGQIELNCSDLAMGTYFYSLIVNSSTIDTKKMAISAMD